MDDTQMSRASDTGATRKRRSSILKTQRPPRTPFSELEFNVATPTDTAKSRRVSFSRRTGVAEFATNEATTTWKNFYEEHNKSLETSNESGSRHAGHLGKRVFHQQFEELEVDLVGIPSCGPNMSSSLANFEHDVMTLECTDDLNLLQHPSNMELSAFPNNTKLFNDPTITGGEVTDRLDINFSLIEPVLEDDLDDIQNELKNNFQKPRNMSDYIQLDLDVTKVVDPDDMSITETVMSPKVESVSGSKSGSNERFVDNDDLDEIQRDLNNKYGVDVCSSSSINYSKAQSNGGIDKENIAVNPYAPVKETENFAVNDDDNQVLVFDGKRLTLQTDKVTKTVDQRKTIVLNLQDDLPNFVNDSDAQANGFLDVTHLKKNLVLEDMSINDNVDSKRTFIYNEDQDNISVTLAVAPIVLENIHKFEDEGNMSMTKVVTGKIAEKRRTIVYEDADGDMSITRAVPTLVDKRKSVYDDINMSMTQAIPSNIVKQSIVDSVIGDSTSAQILKQNEDHQKQCTILYEESCDVSVTQAIPSNILDGEKCLKRNTAVLNSSGTTIFQDEVESDNKIVDVKPDLNKNDNVRRKTIVYDNNSGDISMTQSVPNNIIKQNILNAANSFVAGSVKSSESDTQKRKTIVFNNDDGDISVTQAVSVNQVLCALKVENKLDNIDSLEIQLKPDINKRRTIVFDENDCDISITQALPANVVECFNFTVNDVSKKESSSSIKNDAKRRTVVFNNDEGDISVTQVVKTNPIKIYQNVQDDLDEALNEALHCRKSVVHRTIEYDKDENTPPKDERAETSEKENIMEQITEKIRENETLSELVNCGTEQSLDDFNDISKTNAAFENKEIDTSRKEDVEMYRQNSQDVSICSDSTSSSLNKLVDELSMSIKNNMSMVITQSQEPLTNDISQMSSSFNDLKCKEHLSKTINKNSEDSMLKIKEDISNSIRNDVTKIINQTLEESMLKIKEDLSKSITDMSKISEPVQSATEINEDLANSIKNDITQIMTQSLELSMNKVKKELSDSFKNDTKLLKKSIVNHDVIVFQTTIGKRNSVEAVLENTEQATPSEIDHESSHKQTNNDQNDSIKSATKINVVDVISNTGSDKIAMSKSIINDLLDMSTSDCQVDDKDEPMQIIDNIAVGEQKVIEEDKSKESVNKSEMFFITRDAEDVNEEPHTENEIENLPTQDNHIDITSQMEKINNFFDDKPSNRYYEKVTSPSNSSYKTTPQKAAPVKTADDTNELLAMISDFTDKTMTRKLSIIEDVQETKEPQVTNRSSIEQFPKRQSFIRRQSIVISREDLLNNISMAGAALKSCIDFDDDIDDDDDDEPSGITNEVVKTLQFNESVNESCILDKTPLKKTAFGETSYMYETKSRVIPEFMNIADGVKELTDDLVKPDADTLPFDTSLAKKSAKNNTKNSQVQVNITTSSQIDLTESDTDIDKEDTTDKTDTLSNSVRVNATDSLPTLTLSAKTDSIMTADSYKTIDLVKTSESFRTVEPDKEKRLKISPGRHKVKDPTPVIVFDVNNPLNNIILAPMSHEAHKYNPTPTDVEEITYKHIKEQQIIQYNVTAIHNHRQSGDAVDIDNRKLVIDKHVSIDSADKDYARKDTEVNTNIVMNGNQELLRNNSSLTLVDEDLIIDSEVIETQSVNIVHITDDIDDRKSKKRSRDVNKPIGADETPKPNKKIQKLSVSPEDKLVKKEDKRRKEEDKRRSKEGVIVQRVECSRRGTRQHEEDKVSAKALMNESEKSPSISDVAMETDINKSINDYVYDKNMMCKLDWQPEIIDNQRDCDSSYHNPTDSLSSVVAEIEKLPFMGTECSWQCIRDTWQFSLLSSRVRVCVRLGPRVGMEKDTPVVYVNVETLPIETKNSLAALCVRFASDAMRHVAPRCRRAADAPALVRRCAAAARLARRWGRVMTDARLHLAYSLDDAGLLTLKVANLNLRCVFEVTTQLELVTDDDCPPWVRAGNFKVSRVLPAAPTLATPLPSLDSLEHDWGHAPKAIWKIFKYLKRLKIKEDDIFKIP